MARTEYRADLTEKHFLNVKCKSTSLLWFKPFSSSTQSMFLSPTNETLLDLSIAPNYLFLWHHCLHSHSLPCRPLYSRAKKSLPVTDVYFGAFLYSSPLFHLTGCKALLNQITFVKSSRLTMDFSCTTSAPNASSANVPHNHSIKEYSVQITFPIS